MYAGKDFKKAILQAQANADYFDTCYVVMFDTNGNVRIEHCHTPNHVKLTGASVLVRPIKKEKRD